MASKLTIAAFTLIELLVVLLILGLLLLVALPSYNSFIQIDNRRLAQQVLLSCASNMNQERIKSGDFSRLDDGADNSLLESICQKQIPVTGKLHYMLKVEVVSLEQKYSISAVPQSGLAKDDGLLTLNSNGAGCRVTTEMECEPW